MPCWPAALLLASSLALSACAGSVAGPCKLQPIADLAATLDHNRLEVTASINGAPTSLIVDTGAERTVLSTATVAALRLPHSQRSATRLTGIGGAVSAADVYADLQLGAAHGQLRLAVADIPDTGGLIGGDVLSEYDVELDVPNRRVRLWRAGGCGIADLPWNGPRTAVPLRATGGDRVQLGVVVDGTPVQALLDSGAAMSVMQADTARRIGITQATLDGDNGERVRGVDGGVIGLREHRFGSIAIGGDRVPGPQIGVANLQLGSAELLLGVDYLSRRRVWVSYRTGQMFSQPASPL